MQNPQTPTPTKDQNPNQSKTKQISRFFTNLFKDFKLSEVPSQIKNSFADLKNEVNTEFTKEEIARTVLQLKTNVNLGLSKISDSLSGSKIVEYREIDPSLSEQSSVQNNQNQSLISGIQTIENQKRIEEDQQNDFDSEAFLKILPAQFENDQPKQSEPEFKTSELIEENDDLWISEESEENNAHLPEK